jgi:hypothetical protein
MNMEFRVWITIGDLPFPEESKWLPVIERLERTHPELGPIASWDDEQTMVIVMVVDAPNRATVAERTATIISETLSTTGLTDQFPSVFRIEPAASALAA